MKRSRVVIEEIPIHVALKANGVTYKHIQKLFDGRKNDGNVALICHVLDMDGFCYLLPHGAEGWRRGEFRALVLDALGLRSTHALVFKCGIPLENIDIVSKDLVFTPQRGVKTGALWDGELYDFLLLTIKLNPNARFLYDIVNFDLCATWGKEARRCVKLLFKHHLLDIISILSITCCFRNNTSDWDDQHHDWIVCQTEIIAIAAKYGYFVRCNHAFFRYGHMFICIFKVIHCSETMNYNGGLCPTSDGRVATDWVAEPVEGLPEIRPTSILKKMKK